MLSDMRCPVQPVAWQLQSVALRYQAVVAPSQRLPYSRPWHGAVRLARLDVPSQRAEEQTKFQARAGRLEAVLFLAREPFSSRKLAQLADLADPRTVQPAPRTESEPFFNRQIMTIGREMTPEEAMNAAAADEFEAATGVAFEDAEPSR